MRWVRDGKKVGTDEEPVSINSQNAERESGRKWSELLTGLKADIKDAARFGSNARFDKVSVTKCRVSNSSANIRLTLVADLASQIIRYTYEPDGKEIAVPEGGVFTLRVSRGVAELYSADQQLTSEQARRLVLDPMLLPARSTGLEATDT